jgi:diaminohydroxyphosphoribosylaminopyrimidine deaminase / 5-amino-6-(5-phosphoribosylamino)uracil reductase
MRGYMGWARALVKWRLAVAPERAYERGMSRTYMQRALELAAKAQGRTHPNPMVGAVIVKAGHLVGEGFHRQAGAPHAEVVALRQAGRRAKGATLYVTLEPCCHTGRTPPCTDRIIASGISTVVYAMRDPNPAVAGKGLRALRRAGITVRGPMARREAVALNRIYCHWRRTGRPYVILKVALTLDGKMADAKGNSQWITNAQTRRYVHAWRSQVDGIMVGRRTVVTDDPRLTVRLQKYRGPQPRPIVWVGASPIPWRTKIFSDTTNRNGICIVDAQRPAQEGRCAAGGFEIVAARSVPRALRLLGARDISACMVEGGPETIGYFLRSGCVDYVIACLAPKLLGARGKGWTDHCQWDLISAPNLQVESIRQFGDNCVIEGTVAKHV